MSYSELNQLTLAEELFDTGKLNEALEILNDESHFEGLSLQQKSHFQFLKGSILFYQHKIEEVIKFGEHLFKEGQKFNQYLQSFDGLYFILTGLFLAEKVDEAPKLIEKAEDLLKHLSDLPKKKLITREARINILKAGINWELGNIDLAEKSLEWIFDVQKELVNTFEIVWAYLLKGQMIFFIKSRTNFAMKYFKKALSLAKEVKFNHYWIAICYGFIAIIYRSIGELDNSLKHYMKGSKLIKEFKSNGLDAIILNNIGEIYSEKGEYDLALECLEESLLLYELQSIGLEIPLCSLIEVALKKGDIEYAQKYFHRLENIYNQKKEKNIKLFYQYSKALMLKSSSRIRDKVKAEELLKKVLETKTIDFGATIDVYIHLCDLLLAEYCINENSEILDELNHYIAKLLMIAETSHSYLVYCETFILQAKLALLTFNMKAARRFLTQAQKIAESYGIKRLAMKISHEHDELLKQVNLWEKLKDSEVSLPERWKLTGLSEQMQIMVKKRTIEVPKLSEEEPVIILILTEGGNLLFSKKFMEDFSLEDDILGSFLTAINYVISEVFSEGIDRAVFGQYTLLMMPLQPFLICYIFKGYSYFAHHKIKSFINSLQNDNIIWQSLYEFFQKSKSVQANDIPSLESMVTEIFLKTNIQ